MNATIPPAEYRCPDCSLCGEETIPGDGELICEECRVGWSTRRYWSPGYRLDEETPQCTEEIAPYRDDTEIGNLRYRCVLNKDHKGPHRGGRVDNPGSENVHEWSGSVA